jgi:hypothetical protein
METKQIVIECEKDWDGAMIRIADLIRKKDKTFDEKIELTNLVSITMDHVDTYYTPNNYSKKVKENE